MAFNADDKVVGVQYDGEWTVEFVLADKAGRPASLLPVRVGRGVADFLLASLHPSDGRVVKKHPENGAWIVDLLRREGA